MHRLGDDFVVPLPSVSLPQKDIPANREEPTLAVRSPLILSPRLVRPKVRVLAKIFGRVLGTCQAQGEAIYRI